MDPVSEERVPRMAMADTHCVDVAKLGGAGYFVTIHIAVIELVSSLDAHTIS